MVIMSLWMLLLMLLLVVLPSLQNPPDLGGSDSEPTSSSTGDDQNELEMATKKILDTETACGLVVQDYYQWETELDKTEEMFKTKIDKLKTKTNQREVLMANLKRPWLGKDADDMELQTKKAKQEEDISGKLSEWEEKWKILRTEYIKSGGNFFKKKIEKALKELENADLNKAIAKLSKEITDSKAEVEKLNHPTKLFLYSKRAELESRKEMLESEITETEIKILEMEEKQLAEKKRLKAVQEAAMKVNNVFMKFQITEWKKQVRLYQEELRELHEDNPKKSGHETSDLEKQMPSPAVELDRSRQQLGSASKMRNDTEMKLSEKIKMFHENDAVELEDKIAKCKRDRKRKRRQLEQLKQEEVFVDERLGNLLDIELKTARNERNMVKKEKLRRNIEKLERKISKREKAKLKVEKKMKTSLKTVKSVEKKLATLDENEMAAKLRGWHDFY